MSGEPAVQPYDFVYLAVLLKASNISAEHGRVVYDVIADSVIEGATPDRESVLRLVAFAAGRITFDEYKQWVLWAQAWQ